MILTVHGVEFKSYLKNSLQVIKKDISSHLKKV